MAWADNGINGIYLDEQTSGYSIIGNVFVNAVGDQTVHHNQSPNNTESNNAGTSATTIANAGIEAAYRDIKNFNLVPTCPSAISAPGLIQKIASARFGAASSYRVYSLSGQYFCKVGSLSRKDLKQSYARGIYLIRPENSAGAYCAGNVSKLLITQ